MSLSWKKPSMLDEVIVDYQVSCKDMYMHMDILTKATETVPYVYGTAPYAYI